MEQLSSRQPLVPTREGSLNWQAQGPTWRNNSSGIGLATDRAWARQDTQTQKLRDASASPATAAFAASTERHSAANTNVRLSITDTANDWRFYICLDSCCKGMALNNTGDRDGCDQAPASVSKSSSASFHD